MKSPNQMSRLVGAKAKSHKVVKVNEGDATEVSPDGHIACTWQV